MTNFRWMIYGATGFTGQLLAEEAVRRGHSPILAGRSAEKLQPLADRLGLEWRAVGLEALAPLNAALQGVDLVLHAAGPFIETSYPMVAACLEAGAHYLDITGEIPVFQHTLAGDRSARRRGVALISGCGFDVVPSDCLAAYVAGQVLGASELTLAFTSLSSTSAGTAQSMLELMPVGGLRRRGGRLVPYPLGQGDRQVRFSDRSRTVLPIPWGDLETAYHSTGIPDITTCMAFPARMIPLIRAFGPLGPRLLAIAPLRRLARRRAQQVFQGPDPALQERGRSSLWAEVRAPDGRTAQAWLETPEAYRFTALAGVRCVEKLRARPLAGAFTPAQAFGPDFVLEIPGVRRLDRLEE